MDLPSGAEAKLAKIASYPTDPGTNKLVIGCDIGNSDRDSIDMDLEDVANAVICDERYRPMFEPLLSSKTQICDMRVYIRPFPEKLDPLGQRYGATMEISFRLPDKNNKKEAEA